MEEKTSPETHNRDGGSRQKISRRKATIANLVFQYVTIGLTIVSGFVLVPLYLKYIDFKLYGAWLSTGNIIAWLTLVDPGLSDVIRQRTARFFGAKDFDRMGKAIATGLLCLVVVGFLPLLVSLTLAPFLPRLFELERNLAGSLSSSFALSGVMASLVIIAGAAGAVQQGLQRNVVYTSIYVAGAVTGIVVTVWMLVSGYGLISIPAGLTVRGVIWVIFNWLDILYHCLRRLRIRFALSKDDFIEVGKLTTWTFLNQVSFHIFGQCDALVVGLVMGPEVTPIFVLSRRAWELLRMLLHRIDVAFMPGLAHLYGEGDRVKFTTISQRMLRVIGYVLILGVGLYVGLNQTFVSLWVGTKLYAGMTFDLLMSISLGAIIFVLAVTKVLFARGVIKGPAIASLIMYSLRAGLLIPLVWLFGYLGSPISLIIGFGAATTIYFASQWLKKLNLTAKDFYTDLLRFASGLTVAVVLAILMRQYVVRENLLWFIGCGVVYSAVCITLLSILDSNFRQEFYWLIAKFGGRLRPLKSG